MKGRKPFGRPRRRWVGNNKKDLKEMELGGGGGDGAGFISPRKKKEGKERKGGGGGGGGLGWIHIPQDRDKQWVVVNTVVNLWLPSTAENCWT